MWYYDNYMNNNNLVAKVFLCKSPRDNIQKPFLTGILTSKYNFNVNHEWRDKSDLLSSMLVGLKKGSQVAYKYIEDLLKSGGSKINQSLGATDIGKVSSLLSNTVINSNNNLFKTFGGTRITIQPPIIEVTLITSTVQDNILSIISNIFGDGKYDTNGLGGGFVQGPISNVTTPPSRYRFTYTYNPNHYQQGSYKILTKKFMMTNLVLSSMNVDFSDSVAKTISNTRQPVYAKLTLNFDWCVLPNQSTVVKLLNSVPDMNTGSGDKIVEVYTLKNEYEMLKKSITK